MLKVVTHVDFVHQCGKNTITMLDDIKALKALRGNFNNRDSENLRRLKGRVDKW